ncbi:MAG: sigma-54 dependent transcriptional regulator [Pseudomonadota bacterium]
MRATSTDDESLPSPTVLTLDVAHPLSIRAKSLVFVDPASLELLRMIERVAPSEAPIMIGGDSGTGKELVARHIHRLSGRSGPFMAVNCGAITEQLAESELFGHEAGAFTGAGSRREGWFEAAHQGTLFLDEIGDLPLNMQVKLLRVIQEQEVVRLGSRRSIPVDVRLVTATNVDLSEAVSAGHFRLDLFYRLNIVQVKLLPLRERLGDILPLARHFLSTYSKKLKLPEPFLGPEAIAALRRYTWPGNIRELENVIHFALLVASSQEIRPEHLKLSGVIHASPAARHAVFAAASNLEPLDEHQPLRQALRSRFNRPGPQLFNDLERVIVEEAFRDSGFNQVRSAALLGISRNVMRTLLKKHGFLGEATPGDNLVATGEQPRPTASLNAA